jgi:hypothetical protein
MILKVRDINTFFFLCIILLLIAIIVSILISFLSIDAFNNRDLTLRNCIDYHKNAIEIRVESIKNELDKLCESLRLSLDTIEIEVKTELDALKEDYNEIISKNEDILNSKANIEFLYKYEENLTEIQNFNKIISNKLKKIKFEVNEDWSAEGDIIGDVGKVENDFVERLKIITPRLKFVVN